MLSAPIPVNESERLKSLKLLDLLDSSFEERFDRITKIAQRLFDVPISTLSLMDSNREWFKSCQGLDVSEGPRAISFCGHAMLVDDLFVIPDTLADPRFRDNPMVIGKPYIRFYAGQSLIGPGGHKIGTFCIKDCKPRDFSREHLKLLKDLAIWAEIELNSKELTRAINERRENEKRLNGMVIALQNSQAEVEQVQVQLWQSEKLASIGQLAAGVAHEINNPVGFISNNMEILQEYVGNYTKILRTVEGIKEHVDAGDVEKAKEGVAELRELEKEINLDYMMNDVNNLFEHSNKGLERVRKIVLDLRTFAREDDAENMELIKMEEVMDSILSIVHSELKYKGELLKEYGATPLVRGNVQRLGQVFINLLVNAAQAIEEKGRIVIKTYCQDGYVCLDVSDTGRGISDENLKRIFDPFFTTKPVGQGTGLGLSVSNEIIKKHGGDIHVRSKAGEGTTFTVMLPLI
jgi:two-component system NtrC family sensor kinase